MCCYKLVNDSAWQEPILLKELQAWCSMKTKPDSESLVQSRENKTHVEKNGIMIWERQDEPI